MICKFSYISIFLVCFHTRQKRTHDCNQLRYKTPSQNHTTQSINQLLSPRASTFSDRISNLAFCLFHDFIARSTVFSQHRMLTPETYTFFTTHFGRIISACFDPDVMANLPATQTYLLGRLGVHISEPLSLHLGLISSIGLIYSTVRHIQYRHFSLLLSFFIFSPASSFILLKMSAARFLFRHPFPATYILVLTDGPFATFHASTGIHMLSSVPPRAPPEHFSFFRPCFKSDADSFERSEYA